jgi:hypothetical protein
MSLEKVIFMLMVYADGLPNVGLSLDRLTIWNEIPLVIKEIFRANRIGKPFFPVVHI